MCSKEPEEALRKLSASSFFYFEFEEEEMRNTWFYGVPMLLLAVIVLLFFQSLTIRNNTESIIQLYEMFWNSPPVEIKIETQPTIIRINPCYRELEDRFNPDLEYSHSRPNEDLLCTRCFEPIQLRYGFTECDILLLSQLLAGDKDKIGDGEFDFTWTIQNGFNVNYYEISKVLSVVMNRVNHPRYPNTVRDVVLQPGHFVVMPRNLQATPCPLVIEVIRQWCEAYDRWIGVTVIPDDHLYFTGDGRINHTRANWR